MQVQINGEARELSQDRILLSDLISDLALVPQRIAVEVNKTIVRRGDWDTTTLKDGDHVEIVHFVGGGSVVPELGASVS